MASKPLPGSCSAPRGAPAQAASRRRGSRPAVTGGGTRLEAVLENLQRQQAARCAVEEKLQQEEKKRSFRSAVQSQIHHGALGDTLTAGPGSSTAMTSLHREDNGNLKPCTGEEVQVTDEEESHKDMSNSFQLHEARLSPGATVRRMTTDQVSGTESRSAHCHSDQDWTYEEQFKQEELQQVSHLWNTHIIRHSRNTVAPSGRPVLMYTIPHLFGGQEYLVEVSQQAVEACKEECRQRGAYPCDETVFSLCCHIMFENFLLQHPQQMKPLNYTYS